MTPEIKDFNTWEEAETWLYRHGWGTGLVEEQKILWDEAKKAKPASQTVSKTATKPAATKA